MHHFGVWCLWSHTERLTTLASLQTSWWFFFFFLVYASSSCNPKNPHTSESFDPYERDAVDPCQVLMTPLSQSSGTVELPKKRTNTPKPGPNLLIRTQFALKSFLLLYFSFLLHVILDQVIFCPVKLCSCFNDTHTHTYYREGESSLRLRWSTAVGLSVFHTNTDTPSPRVSGALWCPLAVKNLVDPLTFAAKTWLLPWFDSLSIFQILKEDIIVVSAFLY